MTILGRSEGLVSRCIECDLAEPESLASLGGSAPGVVDGILSAWGGKACDCEWLFQVVAETHVGKLFMPNGVKYFHDLLTVICNFRSCKLHSKE